MVLGRCNRNWAAWTLRGRLAVTLICAIHQVEQISHVKHEKILTTSFVNPQTGTCETSREFLLNAATLKLNPKPRGPDPSQDDLGGRTGWKTR